MDKYEKNLVRKYALQALRGATSGRVTRPQSSLAAWLHASADVLGCPEPDVDPETFDRSTRRIDPDTWAKFAPAVATLRCAANASLESGLQRRLLWLREALSLSEFEADLLGVAVRVALSRPVRLLALACGGCCAGEVNPECLRALTGYDVRTIERALAPGQPLRLLGLLDDSHGVEFRPSATVMRIARMSTADPERLRATLVGKPRAAELDWTDFDHLGEMAELAERLLSSAVRKRVTGVNLLLYGAPGTGKTEFIRTLAERIGATPMFVGEVDDNSGEPTRAERIAEFAICQALAGRATGTLLVVDEADDIFTGVDEDDAGSRRGSKVFMNRLVEKTPAPTVWITNNRSRLGEAVLRRMSLAIRFPEPGRVVRRRVVERIAARRKLRLSAAALEVLSEVKASPAVMDSAVRVAKLAGGASADIERAARSVAQAIEGAPTPRPLAGAVPFDPALSAADHDLAALAERLSERGEMALSFCLHGLPGTGKSAYARFLAGRLGLEVVEKRASDLLSMWVGESEKNIAGAFQEAADRRAMLVLDEADSLLRDRSGARQSWEVTQVNEMLTWMERHPYPFACTTNLMESLDPATSRRFLFKIQFMPMRPDQAREAFRRSFGAEAPDGLAGLDNLAPGDFAVVARKARLMGEVNPAALVKLLEEELAAKADSRRPIGFRWE